MIGGTKKGEYYRSIDVLGDIAKKDDIYYVLAFLYDSQYDRQDILAMMELIHPSKEAI